MNFRLNPSELETLCHSTKQAWKSIGVADWSRPYAEKGNEQFRRSLYFVKELKKELRFLLAIYVEFALVTV